MSGRKKVLTGLECLITNEVPCEGCPYNGSGYCMKNIAEDARELLRPVKPVNIRWEAGINGGNCPKCMNWIQRFYNYCPFCGKGMEWE